MKKPFLPAVAWLLLAACEKKYCWDCETKTITVITSPAKDTVRLLESKHEDICDKSENEIFLLTESRTDQTSEQQGDRTITKHHLFGCHKK